MSTLVKKINTVAALILGMFSYVSNGYAAQCFSCPNGFQLECNTSKTQCSCSIWVAPPLPSTTTTYCEYFSQGYFGYTWKLPNTPEYQCPPTANQASNVDQTAATCIFENLPIPDGNTTAFANCNNFTATNGGVLAYIWNVLPTDPPFCQSPQPMK